MSKQPSDQRSYSVDEMMEKLREGEREKRREEESELVTRPDGTKVVRVRRRKRRTSQPQQKTKVVRSRRWGVIALVLGGALLLVAVVSVLVLLARFNSKGYRENLKERIVSTTGAKVAINDLVITPTRARASSVQFAWPTGGIAKSLKLEDLSARMEPTSFLSSQWKGGEIVAGSGQMILGPPDGTRASSVREGEFPFDYKGYRCSNFNIVYGTNIDEPNLALSSAEVTLRPKRGGGLQFILTGGNARLGPWNNLRIDRGLAELREGRFQLDSLRAKVEPRGQLTLSTTKPLVAGGMAVLELRLESYPLHHLLGSSGFGSMIKGTVDAPAGSITADPRSSESVTAKIQFLGEEASLERFRFLSPLSTVLGKVYYAKPDLGTVEGLFLRNKDGMRIDKFKFESKNQLMVYGSIAANREGELSGSLRVGVPEVLMMLNQTERRQPAFSEPAAGFCWVEVQLRGTLDNPQDNFFEVLRKPSEPRGTAQPVPPSAPAPAPAPAPGGVGPAPAVPNPALPPGITPLTPAPETDGEPDPRPVPGPDPAPESRSPAPSPAPQPPSNEKALEDAFDRLTR